MAGARIAGLLVAIALVAAPNALAGDGRGLERSLKQSLRGVVNGPGGPPGASVVLRRRG